MSLTKQTVENNLGGKRLILWLIVALILNAAMVIYLYVDLYQTNTSEIKSRQYHLALEDVRGDIEYYSEVLTMSSRLYSFTGNEKWKNRYLDNANKLQDTIARSKDFTSNVYIDVLAKMFNDASDKLAAIESKALSEQAIGLPWKDNILFGREYQKQRQLYVSGIQQFSKSAHSSIRLNQLKSRIAYIDEVLTMSARMASFTGDITWEERYLRFVPLLDASIAEALELSNNKKLESLLAKVSDANGALIAIEEAAFGLVAKGDLPAAQVLMFGVDYESQKLIYAKGMDEFGHALSSEVLAEIQTLDKKTQFSAVLILLLFMLLMGFALFVISRVHAWEEKLELRNRELKSKKDELEIFSYSMSHDLKAPLKTILGFSTRIAKHLDRGRYDDLSLLNSHVHKNAEKLDVLIDDIMDVIKSEKTKDLSEEVNFPEIEDHIRDGVYSLGHEHVQLLTSFKHTHTFYGQKSSLKQILENLIGNAFKYHNPGVENPYVSLKTSSEPDGKLQITVSDNGIGIPENLHDKVFSMFFRADASLSFGSGLGLYLVKKKIENMKGVIDFSSSPRGTEFIITLPNKF